MADTTVDLIARADGGEYAVVGGSVSLDFVNLLSPRRGGHVHDWLIPARNADRWAAAFGLPAAGATPPSQLRELRERLARVFFAIVDGVAPSAADLSEIGTLANTQLAQRELASRAEDIDWIDPSPSLAGALAVDAARLLTDPSLRSRVRACRACRRLFLDTTRNRSRTWCDPRECGNRARQRRHYRKVEAAAR